MKQPHKDPKPGRRYKVKAREKDRKRRVIRLKILIITPNRKSKKKFDAVIVDEYANYPKGLKEAKT